jgi:general stress protein YciG
MMKSPRIYTYKITFEETPHWYWGAHKEKKFGEIYMGSPVTRKWMWDFYTPEIQILELFPYTNEGWKEARLVEDRIILPDLNNSLCLNEHVGGNFSLEMCSLAGKKGSAVTNAEKDEFGRSVHAVRTLVPFWETATPEQRSERSRRAGAAAAVSMALEQKTERGRKGGLALAESMTPEQRTERTERSRKNGVIVASQVWESTVDGFKGNAGNVAKHNRANGWDPEAKCRVYSPALTA